MAEEMVQAGASAAVDAPKADKPTLGARGKAACREIGASFKALSKDAKIVVLSILGLLALMIFLPSSSGHSEPVAPRTASSQTSASSLIADAWNAGMEASKTDPEAKKAVRDIQEGSRKLGKAWGELKDAAGSLGL